MQVHRNDGLRAGSDQRAHGARVEIQRIVDVGQDWAGAGLRDGVGTAIGSFGRPGKFSHLRSKESGHKACNASEASDAAGEESCSGTARYTASGFAESEALIGLRIVFRIETDFRVLIDFVAVCGTIDSVMAAVASNG